MSDRRHIILIGFSGSGKSTIGPLLAVRMKRRYVDIDEVIERQSRQSIAEIFRRFGEREFRRREIRTIRDVLGRRRASVVGLGGGAFENRGIREMARANGRVVYLSCSRRELYRRLRQKTDRPLLEVKPKPGVTFREARLDRIGTLLKKRLANYRTADLVISTTKKTPKAVSGQLLRMLAAR